MTKFRVFKLLILVFIIIFTNCSKKNNVQLENAVNDVINIETFGYRSLTKDIDTQSSILTTNENFDFAILGTGFFKYYDKINDKVYYSRNGSMKVNVDGFLINSDGYLLQPALKIDQERYSDFLNSDNSTILNEKSLNRNNSYLNKKTFPLDQNIIVYIISESHYSRAGNYVVSTSEIEDTKSKIIRGALELSNIDTLTAILNLEKQITLNSDQNFILSIHFIEGLLIELRSRYLEIEYKKEFGKYKEYDPHSFEAYKKDLEIFYKIKNAYIEQIQDIINR